MGCTKVGPPPPDFYATLEAIRVELTASAPAALVYATATPVPSPTSAPEPLPTDTPLPPTEPPAPTGTSAPAPVEPSPAAPADVPTAAPSATPVLYTVQQGDYLSLIAAQYGVTVEAIVAANGITNPNVIEVGQVLEIPRTEATPTHGP